MPYKINLDNAREIRAWWKANVHRIHSGEIGSLQMRNEVAKMWNLSECAIRNVLNNKSHREPVQ